MPKYKNTKQAIRQIWQAEGPRGLFSYFYVAILRYEASLIKIYLPPSIFL